VRQGMVLQRDGPEWSCVRCHQGVRAGQSFLTHSSHGAGDGAGSTTFMIGCGRSPGRGSSARPTGRRVDQSRTETPAGSRDAGTAQHPVTSLHINGTPDPHSASSPPPMRLPRVPSRANPLSRIHNPVRHHRWSLIVRSPAAGLPTASSQPICNVPAPSLHPYLGRMRHSQSHDLLLWSLWVGRPQQEGMAVRRNVHRYIFAFDLPDLRDIDASIDEGLQPGGPW